MYGRGPVTKIRQKGREENKEEEEEEKRKKKRGGASDCTGNNKKKTLKLCPLVKILENNNIVNPPPCWEREYIRERAPSVRR